MIPLVLSEALFPPCAAHLGRQGIDIPSLLRNDLVAGFNLLIQLLFSLMMIFHVFPYVPELRKEDTRHRRTRRRKDTCVTHLPTRPPRSPARSQVGTPRRQLLCRAHVLTQSALSEETTKFIICFCTSSDRPRGVVQGTISQSRRPHAWAELTPKFTAPSRSHWV